MALLLAGEPADMLVVIEANRCGDVPLPHAVAKPPARRVERSPEELDDAIEGFATRAAPHRGPSLCLRCQPGHDVRGPGVGAAL